MDLEAEEDEKRRQVFEDIINNFGQAPSQLFKVMLVVVVVVLTVVVVVVLTVIVVVVVVVLTVVVVILIVVVVMVVVVVVVVGVVMATIPLPKPPLPQPHHLGGPPTAADKGRMAQEHGQDRPNNQCLRVSAQA